MKLLIVTVCLLSLSFEGISGSVIKDVEATLEKVREEIIQELYDLAKPIDDGIEKIEKRFELYQMREAELETIGLGGIDFTACANLAETVEGASGLAINISNTVYGIINNVTNSFNMLSHNCSSWNPVSAVECYVKNIDVIRNDVTRVKPLIQLYEKLVMELVAKVEDEFLTCIGDKVPSTNAPTAKPTEAPTAKPTEAPTAKPTEAPTAKPTQPSSNNNTSQRPVTTKKPWWHFW